ncbi:PSD1 and planctomycete cytochrome C domain-containing protein [Singulisphaera sp. Ch08]|uniref:PSD1 and planctomycete cytochrome C domain-containing protein n=1 Tax=Singulisphaera sp. Ch08 TaxID=3120278 RepID=A0AAU7CB12_9BACT
MKTTLVTLLGCLALPGLLSAADTVDYAREVKPLFTKRCVACHGVLKAKAGLRLDTAARIKQGGDGGPTVVPGMSSESLLIEVVTGADGLRMPPEGEPLSTQEIATLKAWIDQGAESPEGEAEPEDPGRHWAFQRPTRSEIPTVEGVSPKSSPIDAFLAAQQKERGVMPGPLADKETLIRRASLDLTGLAPTPTELRTYLEDSSADAYEKVVDRLLASPRYGERWGRHWMDVWRYSDWDGYNKEVRESQPHIWRWRDWIVESLNKDKGYDRMVVEMIAADEAAPDDPEALRATGYLVRNWYKFNRNVWLDNIVEHTSKAFLGITINCARCHDHKYDPIAHEDYYKFRAFFEPHEIRTDRIAGQPDPLKDGLVRVYDKDPKTPTFLFERGDEKRPVKEKPLDPGLPRVLNRGKFPVQAVNLPPQAYYPGARQFVQDETLAQAKVEVTSYLDALAKADRALVDATTLEAIARDPKPAQAASRKAEATSALMASALTLSRANLLAIEAKIAADRAKHATPPSADAPSLALEAGRAERAAAVAKASFDLLTAEQALDVANQTSPISPSYRPGKTPKEKGPERSLKSVDLPTKQAAIAAATKKRDEARKAFDTAQSALNNGSATYASLGTVYPATSTGRRLALANWMASKENPLTARVAVNHIWMRHFGTPLVETVFDFGLNGKGPSNPALLDWLANSFMDSGWSMKQLHRLIVTSQAYRRQSSSEGASDSNLAQDPENRSLWRMNPRRMEAEAVRDNLLHAAGALENNLGGPDLDPNADLASKRRSLYFRHAKEKRVTFLKLFDSANATSCYRRSESVVPQQALALANSPISFEQARVLAAAISRDLKSGPATSDNPAFVTSAFERVLGRAPGPEERTACETYLTEQAVRLADKTGLHPFASGPASAVKPAADPAQRARESLVHVLFNHNDFVTIR